MNLPGKLVVRLTGALALGTAIYLCFFFRAPVPVQAQNEAPPARARTSRAATPPVEAIPAPNVAPAPNVTPPAGAPADAPGGAPKPASSSSGAQLPAEIPPDAAAAAAKPGADEEMQLSFQNANVDMIVQWLAKNTGKSVVKHPKVQCQLTIVSSKKLKTREAVNLVYRALALEGFTTIETSRSILVVPDSQEPKMIPELIENTVTNIPDGRQRLIRIFQLEHADPNEIKDKIKSVLSEKASVEVVDRARQLMITDYTDNIRIASDLIKELDISSTSDVSVEFFKLQHADAEDLATLLSQIINAQPPSARSPAGSSQPGQPGMPGGGGPSGPGGPSGAPQPGPPATAAGGSGSVKIWADKSQNQLIVSAPKSKMSEIRKLLDVLDIEQNEDVTLRVLPLQNVSAEDLVKEISPLYQKMGAKSGKDRVEITANTRSNSLIILSSAENYKAIQKLVAALDREEAQEKLMRAFPLQNADAEDVAKQLDTLNEGQDNNSRYPYYIFYGMGGGGGSRKKPSFVADRRRNAVIVQAPPNQMEGIEKLIKTLDAPLSDKSMAPKIFRLKFISATDMEDVLNELFLKKQQQRNYWDPYNPFDRNNTSGDSSGGKLLGKVRITSEPYSNSIIVTSSSPEGLEAVEAVLQELDSPSQAGETTMRVTLKNARATTVASDINILFARGGSPPIRPQAQQPQPQDPRAIQQPNQQSQNSFTLEQEAKEDAYYPWLGGQQENTFGGRGDGTGRSTQRPVSDLIGRVRVVPDRRSNSLLVTSNLHFFPQIMKLIEDLDAPTPQVLIEAKIIEVASDFRDKLGVRWSPDGKSFTGEDLEDSIVVNSAATYSKVFAGTLMDKALKTGVLDAAVNVSFLIQFMRKNTDAKVLAEPQINIADNEVGKLFVGAQVPFISGSLNTETGGRNDTFQYRDVGIILEVTPHINNAGEVALKIRAEASSIRSGETLFGGAILDTRNFKTDVVVKHGETVVLGGIIQREHNDVQRKVPGFGNIPGLGWAFKKKDKTMREVELMVFLQPRITRTPEQAQDLLREIDNKVPLIKTWEGNRPAVKSRNTEEEQPAGSKTAP
jgi:type II secretion system protein D